MLIWVLVLSPVWTGLLVVHMKPYRQGDPVLMLGQAVGVAVIGLIGLIVSLLTRKASNADKVSLIGYVVAAVLVCGYEFYIS